MWGDEDNRASVEFETFGTFEAGGETGWGVRNTMEVGGDM